MNRKKIILSTILGMFLILGLSIYFLYLKNVNIYEPITIKINGLSVKDCKVVEVVSTTPLNKKIRISYVDSLKAWYYYYSFHKQINVIIPDTLLQKSVDFEIQIGDKKFFKKIKDFDLIKHNKSFTEYALPLDVKSKESVFGMLFSAFHWSMIRLILKSFFVFIIVLIIIYYRRIILSYIIKLMGLIKIIIQLIIRYFKVTAHFIYELIIKTIIVLKSVNKIKKFFSQLFVLIKNERRLIIRWIIIITTSILFALGLFYIYLLFKFFIATYITGLFFIFIIGIILWLLVLFILKILQTSDKAAKVIRKIMIVFLIVLFVTENLLRLLQINISYNERIGLYYSSGFINNMTINNPDPQLLVFPANYQFLDKRPEFTYMIKANKEGLRDKDHNITNDSSEYRIICLGNSFTEGIGTPGDSTWPKLLENKLNVVSKKKISVFNAGKSGSDPFFEYMLLKKRMLKYKPNLVIIGLMGSDLEFYRFRGGFERFANNGLKYRNGPKWEKLYAVSYIFRFITDDILKYNKFQTPYEAKEDNKKALNDIYQCVNKFNETAKEYGFGLLIVFLNDYTNRYETVIEKIKRHNIIPYVNIHDYMINNEKISDKDFKLYYWPIDGHNTSKGYDMLARGVYWKLEKMGIIDTLKKIDIKQN